MHKRVLFPAPWPQQARRRIFPVFLPFSGCPHRCVFCAQDIQTGLPAVSVPLALERAGAALEALAKKPAEACRERRVARLGGGADPDAQPRPRARFELAFFGGTFTALPERHLLACFRFAAFWRERGITGDLRCSTRPDAVNPVMLKRLRVAGFTCVELGVQSFSDAALCAAQRGYSGAQARRACDMVRDAGLRLGIQLMPGMPGMGFRDALADVRQSIQCSPACVRLYPCLVIAGTPLERLWRTGEYAPWALEPAVKFLTRACGAFQRAGIPVIRMGLAEEPGLAENVLAGPRHPALGCMVRSRVLFNEIRQRLKGLLQAGDLPPLRSLEHRSMVLHVPRRFQGEFWGQGAELAGAYAALGLTRNRVRWWDEDEFAVAYTEE